MRLGPLTSMETVLFSRSVTAKLRVFISVSSPTISTWTPRKVLVISSTSSLVTYTQMAKDVRSETTTHRILLFSILLST